MELGMLSGLGALLFRKYFRHRSYVSLSNVVGCIYFTAFF
jgi:hypothetical protein